MCHMCRRDPRLDGFPDTAGPSMSHQYMTSADGFKRQRTDAPSCTIYIPNPSLIGAQVCTFQQPHLLFKFKRKPVS